VTLDFTPTTEVSSVRNLLMLLLDCSQSMSAIGTGTATRISELAQAVKEFVVDDLSDVSAISLNGEIAIGTFSGSNIKWLQLYSDHDPERQGPFVLYSNLEASLLPSFEAKSTTPLGRAVLDGVRCLQERIKIFPSQGLSLGYRPMIYLITDGEPTDEDVIPAAIDLLARTAFRQPRPDFLFTALGVHGAKDDLMNRLAPGAYYPLRDVKLRELMKLITASLVQLTGGGQKGYGDLKTDYDKIRNVIGEYEPYQS
jgi:uncharacterized protein YegL